MSAHRLHVVTRYELLWQSVARKCRSSQGSCGVAQHVACGRRDIQRVGYGMGWERSTLRITGRDTAQIERILTSRQPSASLREKSGCASSMHRTCLLLLSLPVLHARFVVPSESLLRTTPFNSCEEKFR